MSNNKYSSLKIFTVLLSCVLFLTLGSYAAFDYVFTGNNSIISTSDTSIKLLESNDEVISLENQLPISDEEGISLNDTGNVFDFSVETKAGGNAKIGYKINIEKLSLGDDYINLSDDQIKIYLTDENNNKLVGPLKISELDDYNLYSDINIHSKNNNILVSKYRLRVWVDKDVQVKDWDSVTKRGYKFKIGVSSDEKQGGYVITFSANGGSGSMSPSFYEDSVGVLNNNTLTRPGYTFLGWSTTSDGEVEYKDGSDISNLLKNSKLANITLYAVWEAHSYTVKYNANGGSLKLVFTLSGDYPWVNNNGVYESGNNNISDSASTMKSNEFTLTKPLTLSFDWAVSSEEYDYLYYTIYKNGVALSDTGESTAISGNYDDDLTYETVTKTLSAGTYSIEFTYVKDAVDDQGLDMGFVKNINVSNYEMEDSVFQSGINKLSKNTYYREHYVFKGWSLTNNANKATYEDEQEVEDLTTKNNDVVTLYAVWEKEKYNVNVVVQDGIVDVATKQVEYRENSVFDLTPNIDGAIASVTCTNNQSAVIEDNNLTVLNISNNTTCTVVFKNAYTILYSDGTLILNENTKNRNSNIEKHGSILKEYEAMSDSNSYVFSDGFDGGSLWKGERDNIESVEIGQKMIPVSTAYWFASLSNVKEGNFANLDTSQVTVMSWMFYYVGYNVRSLNLSGLSNWDTSNVTSMNCLFANTGYNASTFSLDLSGWDISKVTYMPSMFSEAGVNATTWSVKIPKTTGSLANTTSKWYGSSDSVYASPDSGRSFTVSGSGNYPGKVVDD